jgi:hypothetical protein
MGAKEKSQHHNNDYVEASPLKSFFVEMLTRDIKLEEAILDLLDNCVDGIIRSKKTHSDKTKPYRGFKAEIVFKKDFFRISDNCGGIPKRLHPYALRIGRSKERPAEAGTVGVYGIGMKRAIFKMGKSCLISTQNEGSHFEFKITPEWVEDEDDWHIPVEQTQQSMENDGTTLLIKNLRKEIASRFSDDAMRFKSTLWDLIATHYAFIIDKGLEVTINGDVVQPLPTRLIFCEKPRKDNPSIQPYVFETTADGVDVFMAVGFTRNIPSEDEATGEQEEKQYSSEDAGWTVICNDRVVIYRDKTELTGWGDAGIPRYHTQFIAISGIVEFKSSDPTKLPTTTTKRGIDASSLLYLQIKNKMRDGMRMFTDYTNKWKGQTAESKKQIALGKPLSFEEIKNEIKKMSLTKTARSLPHGRQYKPDLPMPDNMGRKRHISFVKDIDEVRCVAEYLFKDETKEPSAVGEKCFARILREARNE